MNVSDRPVVVTNSAGDVDTNGDLVDELCKRVGTCPERRYSERPGLDEPIRRAGADVDAVRRLLRVAR